MTVGCRVTSFLGAWQERVSNPWLLGVVESGCRLQWLEDPPPLSPCPVSVPIPSQVGTTEALNLEVRCLIGKGAVEEVLNRGSPGFYSQLFVVPVIRRVASRPRPITFEPLPAKIKVQNGDTNLN